VPKHAAITIVSKNYFAFASTLAQSYLRHHPDNDFYIVLVDRADGHIPETLPCGAQVVEMADLAIPDVSRFIYRYSIMELNTAVKPFALAHLFEVGGYETLLYIDPDIWVMQPLTEIYGALERASVVLTPHIRKPYYDDAFPSDLSILQSGTYNLGFIGLRRGASATQLLDWWMSKLYRDCIVDIPSGLFVDQKWIDMVPGMFPDHAIIYHPGYNVAYWNLHERTLRQAGQGWTVDDLPLAFFHFSGYVPYAPHTLSKHQNRHDLASLPDLKALTDAYAVALAANNYEESARWPYAFSRLGNGVKLPMQLVNAAMQWASRAGVACPCPVIEPDEFARFLMSRGLMPERPKIPLIFHFLLKLRGDVASAFPNAGNDPDDPGFRSWLQSSGKTEYELSDLLEFEQPDAVDDHVAEVFLRLRADDRRDVFEQFARMWQDESEFQAFADWVESTGADELGLGALHSAALRRALPGIETILHLYFLRGDLQLNFAVLSEVSQISRFTNWLRENRIDLELSNDQISLFSEFAAVAGAAIERMRLLYQHRGQKTRAEPDIYAIDVRRFEIGSTASASSLVDWLAGEEAVDPVNHFLVHFGSDRTVLTDFSRMSVPGLEPRKNFSFVKQLQSRLQARNGQTQINLAGYFRAPTGMGESGRSMRSTLGQSGMRHAPVTLPGTIVIDGGLPSGSALFGWPAAGADLSITVANADAVNAAEQFLPRSFWARHNIGYWVWETEQLPARWRRSQERFDEIWTPSEYSAQAIRRTVDLPVKVLPHTLDFASIDRAVADRSRYGLPAQGLLFGFAFDPNSAVERKNVRALVAAFGKAFRADDDCYLILKVNGRSRGAQEFEAIRASCGSSRILFLEATLDRDATFGFLKSLNAYVSLHRAEGFGLSCAEAMALGLPVVATGYSGNMDFMNADNSILVPARVIETGRAHGPYPAGTRWGDPDVEHAAQAMRSLMSAQQRAELGARAAASIREQLGTERIGALARTLVQSRLG
jgi:glycosyltransferase involved in cell wall biosynthesis